MVTVGAAIINIVNSGIVSNGEIMSGGVEDGSSATTKAFGGSSNVLMCKQQWWKVCWIYGDQEKYYRHLYGGQRRRHKSMNAADDKKNESEIMRSLDGCGNLTSSSIGGPTITFRQTHLTVSSSNSMPR